MGAAEMVRGLLGGEDAEAALDVYLSCLGNASQCYINLSEWGGAETNCSKAIHDENLHTQNLQCRTLVCNFVIRKATPCRSHANLDVG